MYCNWLQLHSSISRKMAPKMPWVRSPKMKAAMTNRSCTTNITWRMTTRSANPGGITSRGPEMMLPISTVRIMSMKTREYNHLFKVVIVGNSNVGKSSIVLRFADGEFNETYITTIGVDFRFKSIEFDNRKVKLQIWDTAGQ